MDLSTKVKRDQEYYTWLRKRVLIIGSVLVCFCAVMAIITHKPGSPGHLVALERPAYSSITARVDASGPHDVPTAFALMYKVSGAAQTPGKLRVLVDGKEVAVLTWTDYKAFTHGQCGQPWYPGLDKTPEHGHTLTVVPDGVSGDWYVDLILFPTLDECFKS